MLGLIIMLFFLNHTLFAMVVGISGNHVDESDYILSATVLSTLLPL